MTFKELREEVADSPNYEQFKAITLNLVYKHIDIDLTLEGISGIYRYFKQQKEGWNKRSDSLPNQLESSKGHFVQLTKEIENFVNQNKQTDGRQFNRNRQSLSNRLKRQNVINGNEAVFTYDAPETEFLLELNKDFPSSFNAAFIYFARSKNQQLNLNNAKREDLIGYILSYEFDLQDHTDIKQRRDNEKISLGLLRNKFEEHVSEIEEEVQETIKDLKNDFDEHSKGLDELQSRKKELFEEWFGQSKEDFNSFYRNAQKEAQNLQEVYREGLRLAGPVKYWKKRALDMKKNGAWWLTWFGGSIGLAAITLFILLWIVPEGMTASLFKGDPIAIKWTLLFVTFISFLAYGVRTFAKLTFSSYHLARDAEEREQLTHVYLALKNDANVEEKERHLILQALFSRAETGLLKDDAAPTMPATILEKINNM